MQIEGPFFVHEARPGRVIFGWGARRAVGEELARLGVERAMIITTPSRADVAAEFARLLLGRVGIVYPGAQPNAPIEVTEAALTAASSVKADGLLAIGGGTAIGLSKAISLRTNLPQVAAPTTFSGCEMAPFLSETERGARIERRSQDLLPRATIYDPELVAHLPPSIAGPSAMNAMANAFDALCAPNASPSGRFRRDGSDACDQRRLAASSRRIQRTQRRGPTRSMARGSQASASRRRRSTRGFVRPWSTRSASPMRRSPA